MTQGQAVESFIAKLIKDCNVPPEAIEHAVNATRDVKLGESICDDDMLVRAFATEQSKRLTKGK